MFVGHYSVAFACRTERNKIPLWVLFVAVQFLDYIWATLVLLGIEKLRVIKGFTAGSMLDSYFHPYSHSLITAVIWSVVAAFVYKTVCSRHGCHYSKSAPLIIGLAVFSHWILDLVAHPRDLRSTTTQEGRLWFVELSRPGVCVGDRVARRRHRSLPDAKCDAGNPQGSCDRVRNCSRHRADRRHVRAANATDGQSHSHGRLDFLYAVCSHRVRVEKIGRRRQTNAP